MIHGKLGCLQLIEMGPNRQAFKITALCTKFIKALTIKRANFNELAKTRNSCFQIFDF